MRLTSLALFFGAVTAGLAQAIGADKTDDPGKENTYFNGKRVPPLLELTSDNFNEEAQASKFLVVKYFNPYCPHCQLFAPTYQTMYEFYYTSTVSDVPFEKYYDIRFATLDCMVNGDLCTEHEILAYPRTYLYKDGKRVEFVGGAKEMKVVSDMIEKALEEEKPGTRPKELLLPEPEATESPDYTKPRSSDAEKEQVEKEDLTASKTTIDDILESKEKTKPAKPTVTPNKEGNSVPLTAESFQELVTMTQEPWFIKFYAPWCHHCQAMAPNWQQMAKEMKGRLNVGEVNCDVESRLCKDVRLKGYPTILFFKGGERVEYDGLRGFGDFLNYAEKALDICEGIKDVDAASLAELEKKEEVIFIYFYDRATASEDFQALERLPLSLIGRAKLVKTDDPVLYDRFKITTWPRLLVSREGRPTYYTPLTPREMRDTHMVLSWMKSVWLPIVPELTASNAREIMDGKMVVLGILNREDKDSFTGALHEMKEAANDWMDKQIQAFQLERQNARDAKQLRLEEAEDRGDQRGVRAAKNIRINMDWSDRKEVAFAWVDGTFWQRWIRTTYGIDSKDGDRVIINDEDNRRYWDQTINEYNIVPSRVSILETLSKVTANPPLIKPKLTISSFEKVFFDIKMNFIEHPYLSFGCIAGIAFGVFSWYRGNQRRNRLPFGLEETLPIREFKDGLLGNNANGKND
ncbi:thioredoxin-like protein [Xylaria bambusicola]|uniref:thioredoxin-like protein n=1 Tax=Xylaria bambusicola TaxID=326684 RepID=UPI002007AAE4|nr:thioredoxin-like protein [Xylaria bambusicola]KAI0521318.1 thioredoxin-like protein [Xylaria bambusicola]